MSVQLPVDADHDVLVVIPTVAHPEVLVETVVRMCAAQANDPNAPRLALVLSINSPAPVDADDAVRRCREVVAMTPRLDMHIVTQAGPIGFGAANNRGLMAALVHWGGLPELVVFHNDDAHVTKGWLQGLLDGLHTDTVHGYSEPWDFEGGGKRAGRPVAMYGRIGLVGPSSNLVAGIQLLNAIKLPDGKIVQFNGETEHFAPYVKQRYGGQRVTADFLSGFCVGLSRECIADLLLEVADDGASLQPVVELDVRETLFVDGSTADALKCPGVVVGPWDEVTYPIAGYEDNDLCMRAELVGWRSICVADCFVGHIGHQTFDRLFPDALRGMRNRLAYYRRWAPYTQREQKLVAAYRLKFEVGHDMHLMRQSVTRAAQLCDGIAVVLTGNPLEVQGDDNWQNEERNLTATDKELIQACHAVGEHCNQVVALGTMTVDEAMHYAAGEVALYVRAWIAACVAACPGARWGGGDTQAATDEIVVHTWLGAFNERDERNVSHSLAEGAGADWIVSIDSDEVIENRVDRAMIERLMKHPDPLVRSWDQSWVNHWDSARLQRDDKPWGDGGAYVGGMHGFRLWRVPRPEDLSAPVAPRRIMAGTDNGLHCGNSPDHDVTAKRVSAIRFRHFGYTRHVDRVRKHRRYQKQDPNPDRVLTGGMGRDAYAHILGEEGMRLSPYSPVNGIGLHILVHRGETSEDMARVLDLLYGVVDRIVLVWTGDWTDDDKVWLWPAADAAQGAVAARAEWDAASAAEHEIMDEPAVARLSYPGDIDAIPHGDWKTGPTREQAEIAARFGCAWVHQPMNDDLAAARNAGIEALFAQPRGLGWSLFWDLDEYVSDPFGVVIALRRMAETSDAHGWLFHFLNHHTGQNPSRSESIRMARMLPDMRLKGRVHETYDAALVQYREKGAEVIVRVAPFVIDHLGLAADDAKMDAKLIRYFRLLNLELLDDPHNSTAWVALGLHYLNEDREDFGVECLNRAVLCGGDAYLAFREMAVWHLRKAQPLLREAVARVGVHSEWARAMRPLLQAMDSHVAPLPVLGSARNGGKILPPSDLPPFPIPQDLGGLGITAADLAVPGLTGAQDGGPSAE